jgi:nanoRNase/pAp phosphatase (c-di-AMP/oligoRNAs hydrolase)
MAMPGRSKISVGCNPWRGERRTANIASICGRYGGGGHPVVGAVSLTAAELPRTRQIAAEISAELRAAALGEV